VEADIDYNKVAKITSGFSGSDLKEVCRLAALTRLQEVDTSDSDW
jgi:SpoVK/Ycf46/Vps4 family AAA+-type ATPase